MTGITKNRVAAFRYIMRNGKEEVLENTLEGMATTYLHGSNGIQEHLQSQLEGLKVGDKKMVYLSKSSGLTADDFTFEVIIDQVREALPEELVLGYPVQLDSLKCEDDCDCYQV